MTLVFSIGHSNHDWETFKRLLETANIGTVADVRSSPASRLPHFNRAALKDRSRILVPELFGNIRDYEHSPIQSLSGTTRNPR